MTNRHSTKRAFFASVMALILCFTMLLGTTYAWFTDTVTSTGNKIQAGTLKIDLALYNTETSAFDSIKTSKAPIFDYKLWEPGYTDVKLLKVKNEGTLALKWKATIVGVDVNSILADVIDVYVLPIDASTNPDDAAAIAALPADRTLAGFTPAGTLAEFVAGVETTTVGKLNPKDAEGDTAYLCIALKMQEGADNQYQGLSLGSFDIQILATQLNYESDSIDKNYDENAEFANKVIGSTTVVTALANGGDFTATEDINAAGSTVVAADGSVLDLDGYALTADYVTAEGDMTISNGTLTFSDDGYMYTEANSNITLENVVIDSNMTSIMAYDGGTITLKNVAFENTATSNPLQNYGGNLVLEDVTVAQAGNAASAWYESALQVINTIVANDNPAGPAWKITSQANTTVNSGTYTGKKAIQISAPGGNVTINGGTFVGSEYVINADFAPQYYADGTNYKSIITINGGDFTGAIKISAATQLVIKGGTFSVDPTAYVPATGYVVTNNGGTWTVTAE